MDRHDPSLMHTSYCNVLIIYYNEIQIMHCPTNYVAVQCIIIIRRNLYYLA